MSRFDQGIPCCDVYPKIYLISCDLSVNIQRTVLYSAVDMPSKTTRLIYEIATDICGISSSVLNVSVISAHRFKNTRKNSYPDNHIRVIFSIRV